MKEDELINEYKLIKLYKFTYNYEVSKKYDIPDFELCDSNLERSVNANRSQEASVYVWASKDVGNNELDILYVGKAGYGVKVRLGQHITGFKYNAGSKGNRDAIIKEIKSGREVFVYCRESGTQKIFKSEVSLYSAEENALYLELNPKLNKEGFPVIHSEDLESNEKLISTLENDFISIDERIEDLLMSYLGSISEESTKLFSGLINYVHSYIGKGCSCKLAMKYSGQPNGLDGIPMIVYASNYGTDGRALSFISRISLSDYPRIIFNVNIMSDSIDKKLVEIIGGVFSPINSKYFIENPDMYLKVNIR